MFETGTQQGRVLDMRRAMHGCVVLYVRGSSTQPEIPLLSVCVFLYLFSPRLPPFHTPGWVEDTVVNSALLYVCGSQFPCLKREDQAAFVAAT